MNPMIHRREFLLNSTGAALAPNLFAEALGDSTEAGNLRLARFRFDVTPPMGHSLCGGWIQSVLGVDDPLEALGYVLLGSGKPIVVCVVDWTGLLNQAHLRWRESLAQAAGTSPDRVAVHCVHQHNAPFACLDAEQIVAEQGDLPHIIEPEFFQRCLDRGARAVRAALDRSVPVTHVARGEGRVVNVASNRRIIGLNGKHRSQRGSASKNPDHHRYPEGLIDPILKTVVFYHGSKKLVASHYYACHPMSYYGDGRVSADFCGLARRRRQADEPDCLHLYFNGCGGNIGAGKYNDGSKAARVELIRRIYEGITASEADLRPEPIRRVAWDSDAILPPLASRFNEGRLMREISNQQNRVVDRNRRAYTVAFIRRVRSGTPILLSSLRVNNISLLHLPAECFVEYQLRAQAEFPDRFVACAAYGDGGAWYLPTQEAYPQGGYAVSVAWCGPEVDSILSHGIRTLLRGA